MRFRKGMIKDDLMLINAIVHHRKALEILYSKQVDVELLIAFKTVNEYNGVVDCKEKELSKEQFRILKEMEVIVKHASNS